MPIKALEGLLDEKQAAAVLHVPVSTLRFWRSCANRGPRYERVIDRVRYKPAELARYKKAAKVSK